MWCGDGVVGLIADVMGCVVAVVVGVVLAGGGVACGRLNWFGGEEWFER